MEPWLIWILLGLLGLGLELLLPGVFMVWIGLAALGTGVLVGLLDLAFGGAVTCFALLVLAGVIASLRLRRQLQGGGWRVNAPESGLAGRLATVLSTEAGQMRVRLGDSDWTARLGRGPVPLPEPGMVVRVEAVDGTVLVVRPHQGALPGPDPEPEGQPAPGSAPTAPEAAAASRRPAPPPVPEAVRRARLRLSRVAREPMLADVAASMGGVLDDLTTHPEWLPLAAQFLNVHLDGLDRIVDRLAAGATPPEGLPRLLEDLQTAALELRSRLRAEETAALEIQVKVLAARLREEGFA